MDHSTLSADHQLKETNFIKKKRFRFKPFSRFNKVYLLVISYMLLFAPASFAFTIWFGGVSNDWHTPRNWSNGIPDIDDDVRINPLAQNRYSPVITSEAVAKSVVINGGFLKITIGGELAVSGSVSWGIDNSGSIENNGTLSINNTGRDGILMRTTESLFTNKGTLSIGNTGNIGTTGGGTTGSGIANFGSFVNESGSISINRTLSSGKSIFASAAISNEASFINKARINIGGFSDELNVGIGLLNIGPSGTFFNQVGAILSIDQASGDGIANYTIGIITNQGAISIGAEGSISGYGILNSATFENNGCAAYLNIASDNIINSTGTFNNSGTIIENSTGNSNIYYNTGMVQNLNGGNFNIRIGPGAITTNGLIWKGCTSADWNTPSNWNVHTVPTASDDVTIVYRYLDYKPVINIANAVAKSVSVESGGVLNISDAGILTINVGNGFGISNAGTVTNNGILNIGLTTGTSWYGIKNEGTFNHNSGTINIDHANQAALYNGSGTFTNRASLFLKTMETAPYLVDSYSGTISNSSTGTLHGSGKIRSAYFTNDGGIISLGNSPGLLAFDGNEDFSNSTLSMEINGTGVAGTDYDQVAVNGIATLGGTLALTFNLPIPIDGDVITILDATKLSGTFNSVTGLPENWTVKYNTPNAGEVSLVYSNVLPVTLVYFTAKKLAEDVKLDWQTTSETSNQGFGIERKHDDGKWENIGFMDGHGTTTENRTYSFLDKNPLSGMNYYRLRQLDFDGSAELSRIVNVETESANLVKMYPNPTSGILHIERVESGVKIFDILGRLVMNVTIVNQKIDVSSLPAGLYFIAVISENREKSISFVKQ
ncbi:T9SS type A sorting domain-containing protein [Dyadobacter psychrotolerans]|uniref:T9SS type A sorting domain-containing protein n=1 Tax=Dyadobacter psychrotolerans TaxID=2541721 RepID=A0A4R5DX23_9BACT|nr:T9SS type A sorting domain-containing protein [Dyadobacter psychrotolerans]TDE15623.1 T9SS type A sorting domain-containing protein [Dyadobacter psychrotolerans]